MQLGLPHLVPMTNENKNMGEQYFYTYFIKDSETTEYYFVVVI